MKKDGAIALIAVLVIGGITYGLAAMRPPYLPTKSTPFSTITVGKTDLRHVVMRVNGEPVTEEEFQAAFDAMPEDMKRQFASAPGKQAFAEQLIRLKLLEQEGRRMGIDRDPKVAGQIASERTTILANATAEKIVGNPTDEAIQRFYNANQQKFQAIDVSHILIAYRGGAVPPRSGQPLSEQDAMNRARAVYQQVKGGADFAATAQQFSDDPGSAAQGGKLGSFGRGMLPKEIEARVFALKKGEISEPLPSRFGIHIFKVTGFSLAALRDVTGGISRHVKQQNMFDRVEALRKVAKVDFDPKFFPEAKDWPGAPTAPGKRPS